LNELQKIYLHCSQFFRNISTSHTPKYPHARTHTHIYTHTRTTLYLSAKEYIYFSISSSPVTLCNSCQ